ncbi:type II secretion system F family protein [Candidatus Woesearchaeota archaeon]|nr:type II secretion system F family protein [Candidatus Woesearchaeota archaeon]
MIGIGDSLQGMFPFLKLHLKQAQIDISVKEYLSACIVASLSFSVFFGALLFMVLRVSGVEKAITFSLAVSGVFTLFVLLQQIVYPKIFAQRRVKDIEKNLLPTLQNMVVQLNAGVPLFDAIVNIANSDYGGVSTEFSRAVKSISAGNPQIEALEEIAAVNPSLFFRRAIWQLVNGMKSGADISRVINEIISSLSEEQLLQIQRYGSQLNPLAMFYMLVVVIVPSLGMTFLIILSSFISLDEQTTKTIFWALLGIVVFFQIMFMGIIKSKRPNLLSD